MRPTTNVLEIRLLGFEILDKKIFTNLHFKNYDYVCRAVQHAFLVYCNVFSSSEPKAHGELIGWDSSWRQSVRLSVRSHFQT